MTGGRQQQTGQRMDTRRGCRCKPERHPRAHPPCSRDPGPVNTIYCLLGEESGIQGKPAPKSKRNVYSLPILSLEIVSKNFVDRPWSIFRLKRFASQTVWLTVSRKKRVHPAWFGPGGAVPPPRVLPFSKVKRSILADTVRKSRSASVRRAGRIPACRTDPHGLPRGYCRAPSVPAPRHRPPR